MCGFAVLDPWLAEAYNSSVVLNHSSSISSFKLISLKQLNRGESHHESITRLPQFVFIQTFIQKYTIILTQVREKKQYQCNMTIVSNINEDKVKQALSKLVIQCTINFGLQPSGSGIRQSFKHNICSHRVFSSFYQNGALVE